MTARRDMLDITVAHVAKDRFRVVSRLGEGATSVLFAAQDALLNRPVALKVLLFSGDEGHRRRFLREGCIASLVKHRNVVELLDVVDGHASALLVLELVRGRPPLDDGLVVGTPGYMSPEQGRGDAIDERADVFSLGVLLYEMLTGARPFAGRTAIDTMIAVERAEPAPPSSRRRSARAELDQRLDRVVLQCLAKDPRARHADAIELLEELKALSRLVEPG